MRIYSMDMRWLTALTAAALCAWGALRFMAAKRPAWRMAFLWVSGALALVALYGVLSHTMLGRVPSGVSRFAWYNTSRSGFLREMYMNVILYVPVGVALTELMGPWSVALALAMSVGIESWQYFAGTGLAQGTDVVCNALGCAIGALPWLVTVRVRSGSRHAVPGDGCCE